MTPKFNVGDLVMYYPLGSIPVAIDRQWFMGVVTSRTTNSQGSSVYLCEWFRVRVVSNVKVLITLHSRPMSGVDESHIRFLLGASDVDCLANSL